MKSKETHGIDTHERDVSKETDEYQRQQRPMKSKETSTSAETHEIKRYPSRETREYQYQKKPIK